MLGQSLLLVVLAFATLVVAADSPLPVRNVEDKTLLDAFQEQPSISYRLPNDTRPISYDVQLTTHIHTQTDFSFTGVVAARFVTDVASNTITLHQRQLTIGTYSLVLAGTTTIIPLNAFNYDTVTEFLTFTLTTGTLNVNSEYILTINFNGTLRTDQAGFYRSSYLANDGSRRWLATTQFESTNARHGFPCWDEPAFRALLTLRITHGTIYHAISNMPVVNVVPSSIAGYSTTTFEVTSAPTPSYLFAYIVSDFEYKQQSNDRNFVQRVFARSNGVHLSDFSLDTGVKSLNAFEAYFGINFTFPKMDQAAIPDFAAGAMENWGLVTYREVYLLFNEATSTFTDLRNIATVIAHEYAHQWFGNRVTAKWWSYIWLNEGFATLFEAYGTDWVFPEWKILDSFVYEEVQSVMVSDATPNTRPMTFYAESPNGIANLFDNVAYSKSGCVLRMFLHAFTEETFKRGLISYLNAQANSVATEDDLFAELERAVKADGTLQASLNVPTIFSSWSRQAGFPLVTVERNYEDKTIRLSQERYFTTNQTTPSTSRWYIPFNYATGSSSEFEFTNATAWFSGATETINDESILPTDWFLLNKRQTGYYRVKYDLQNYKLLAEQLNTDFNVIHLTSRSQLIDDAFDFARTERLGYDVVFDLLKYLEHEVEYVPWASTFRGLNLVDRLFSGSTEYERFTTFIQKQLDHLYTEARLLAAAGEHHYRKQARNLVVQWSCRFGSEKCLEETNLAVDNYLSRNVAIHQDHRTAILCGGVRSFNETQFTSIVNRLQTENDSNDRLRLLDAVSCTTNMEWAELLLNMTINGASVHIRTNAERLRVFSAIIADSQHGAKLGYDFFHANIDVVYEQYGSGNANTAIGRLASQTVNAERTQQFEDLATLAATKEFIAASTINNARTTLAANKRWTDRNDVVIGEWLKENSSAQLIGSLTLMAVLLFVTQLF